MYLPEGGTARLDLADATGTFEVRWYDPRHGGVLQEGRVPTVEGGGVRGLGEPPSETAKDWAVLVRRVGPPEEVRAGGPAFTEETNVLVKLRTPIGAHSRVGDRVRASVISPETYLGGVLDGEVAAGGTEPGGLSVRFDELLHGGDRLTLRATVSRFVNSKGHELVDEDERPAVVTDGAIVSDRPGWVLDEGAELALVATPDP